MVLLAGNSHQGICGFAQESGQQTVNKDVARALDAIRRGGSQILLGFDILSKVDFAGTCPSQLLDLVHSQGDGGEEIIWRLGMELTSRKLSISGQRLAAEYEKAGKAGRRARQALCAFAAYQTGRWPPDYRLGGKAALPNPRPLDEETLALLARALTSDDPPVRVAAADSIRLAGIRDQRFREPLLQAIRDEDTVVSGAASLAAAELEFAEAGPAIVQRLETHLQDPVKDSQGDLAAGILRRAFDLWGDYYSPYYGRNGWVQALGMLRHRPALKVLRQMAAPHERSEEEKEYLTGGESEFGGEKELAQAIIEIEHGSFRPAAALQLAEDKTLAGNVRAAALRRFDGCDKFCVTHDPTTRVPLLTDVWRQYYEPEVLQRVIRLIADRSPIGDRANNPSRLGRLAAEVAARKFSPWADFYQARLHSQGKPSFFGLGELDVAPRPLDPLAAYPENLLPLRRQLQEKLESLLPGDDGALALEALAVACPEWGTIEKYVGIATDRNQQLLRRVTAANLLTWQPLFLEMEGGGRLYGKHAPPQTASKLLPLLEIQGDLPDGRQQETVTGVFLDLLGTRDGALFDEQKAARKELLPKLRAMRNSPHADAALTVLREVYGFSRAAIAWDASSGDPAEQPRPQDEMGAGAHVGPPAEITARRSFPFSIRLFTPAQNGKTLLVGDGRMGGSPSESRVLLLNPHDLSDKAKTSITESLPWLSSSAVRAWDEQHVLVFNRVLELPTLKTVSVLDIDKAVARNNVSPIPLAVSPDGKVGLVHLSSYVGSELDTLALFDLASGKLQRTIAVAEEQPIQNACFLKEQLIAVHGWRGCVLAVNLANGTERVLCDNGPRTLAPPAATGTWPFSPRADFWSCRATRSSW